MTIMSCEFESHLLHEKANIAEVAQLVEHNLAKVRVAGPSPVFRSRKENQTSGSLFSLYNRFNILTLVVHPAQTNKQKKRFNLNLFFWVMNGRRALTYEPPLFILNHRLL